MASLVEQVVAECLCHARAPVVGGTAPDTHDEVTRSGVVGVLQQFADPERRRHTGIAALRRHQCQASCLRHLDDGCFPVIDQAIVGVDRIRERPAHSQRPTFTVGCRDQGVNRPIAAIGYRHEHQVGIGRRCQDAIANRLSGLERR